MTLMHNLEAARLSNALKQTNLPARPPSRISLNSMMASPDAVIVFAVDVRSQPQFLKPGYTGSDSNWARCGRAIAIAEPNSVVVLQGKADKDYVAWLKELNLGPAEIIEYGDTTSRRPLADLILENPAPVQEAIERVGKTPCFVPFYCSKKDLTVAHEVLKGEVFGCDEEITAKFFDKNDFKNLCTELGLPTVGGQTVSSETGIIDAPLLAEVVRELLTTWPKLILRGSKGAAGNSLYLVDDANVEAALQEILKQNESCVLVEQFRENVIASPNDQWVINGAGDIYRLGLSTQLFENLHHRGNISGEYMSADTRHVIEQYSAAIVNAMARQGYIGLVGIDYIVTPDEVDPWKSIYPIECNARLNGSSFAFGIIDKVEQQLDRRVGSWKFYRAATSAESFAQLREQLGDVLYDGTQRPAMMFPFDCDALKIEQKFSALLLAEDRFHMDWLQARLEAAGIQQI